MILFTNKSISPIGKVNPADLKAIAKWTAIFFAAPALMYLGQLQGDLSSNHVITSFLPSLTTIGAIEAWGLGAVINFLLKLTNISK